MLHVVYMLYVWCVYVKCLGMGFVRSQQQQFGYALLLLEFVCNFVNNAMAPVLCVSRNKHSPHRSKVRATPSDFECETPTRTDIIDDDGFEWNVLVVLIPHRNIVLVVVVVVVAVVVFTVLCMLNVCCARSMLQMPAPLNRARV